MYLRKFIIFIIAGIILVVPFAPAQAAFWSGWFNWFNKSEKAITSGSVLPPVEKPVDAKDVERRLKILEQVVVGEYRGNPNINVSFTQKEITQAVLPLAEKYLQNFADQQNQGAPGKITSVILGEGSLEISGAAAQPVKSKAVVSLGLKASQGKLALQIQKVKIGWFVLPQFVINKGMEKFKIKPENLIFPLPNFSLTELKIGKGEISIAGKYVKGK